MIRYLSIAMAAAVCAGCATTASQPSIQQATIEPNRLQPGDTAVISVDISDRFGVVDRVEGVVKEDPTLNFQLKDDGKPPDAEAGDGIWTLQVAVPFNAPPGDFEFQLTAYDESGQPVVVRDENDEVAPLTANFGLEIQIPPQS